MPNVPIHLTDVASQAVVRSLLRLAEVCSDEYDDLPAEVQAALGALHATIGEHGR